MAAAEVERARAQVASARVELDKTVLFAPFAATIAEARRVAGDGPVYLSFDVDALDPVYAPGTGTPEIGGFTTREAQLMIRGLQGLNIVGGDVVEVSPPFDPTGMTALVGATMMYEILCIMADGLDKRK